VTGAPPGRLVVGVGSPDRGDDAVGPAVAWSVAALASPGVRVVVHEDPTDLVHLWQDCDLAIVVDAVVSGRRPGDLVIVETGSTGPRLPEDAWAGGGRGGTHGFGVAAAIELSRALGRLPRRVVLVGIEVSTLEVGAPMSHAVLDAVPVAVAHINGLLAGATAGDLSDRQGQAQG